MPSDNLSFRTPQHLMEQIKARDPKGMKSPGAVAKREVERWYTMLGYGMEEISLSPAEAVVLISWVGRYEGKDIHLVFPRSVTSPSFWLGEEFRAAGVSLLGKLNSWSIAGRCAAWDAAERYEALVSRNTRREEAAHDLTFGMALHVVGLHSYALPPDELATVERMGAKHAEVLPGEYLRALEAGA